MSDKIPEGMIIHSVFIRNWKGIRKISYICDPEFNILSGANGAGKTSFLEALEGLIRGTRYVSGKALRDGTSKGEVEGEIGRPGERRFMTARRAISSKNPKGSLSIKRTDGEKMTQTDLNDLFNEFSFDPVAFDREPLAKKVKLLQDACDPKSVEALHEKDEAISEAFENRRVLKAKLSDFPEAEPCEKVDHVDPLELQGELREAEKFNAEQRRRAREKEKVEESLEYQKADIESIKAELAKAEATLEHLKNTLQSMKAPEPEKNIAAIQERVFAVLETNAAAEKFETYEKNRAERKELREKVRDAESHLEDLRADRAEIAREMKLPVEGLAWTDDGITLNGIPFEELSSGERIRIATRVGMSMNQGLSIMFIREGSLLDRAGLEDIRRLARENKYQVFVEAVGEGYEGEVVIEEGEIRQADGDCPFGEE